MQPVIDRKLSQGPQVGLIKNDLLLTYLVLEAVRAVHLCDTTVDFNR